jgi:LysM repeat protein
VARTKPFVETFTITSQRDDTTFRAYFGDGSPIITDGYGGWQVTARPKEVGLTEWIGRNPMQIELPFMIDNWMDDDDDDPGVQTESEIRKLEKMCGLGGHQMPPIVTINGHGVIPHDDDSAPGYHNWVVENIQWDRSMEFRSGYSGRRIRAGGTITLRQYIVASDVLARLGPKSRARPAIVYYVKKDDTLSKIAAKFYKNANKWKIIADANNLRDSRSKKLHVHKRLIIPQ